MTWHKAQKRARRKQKRNRAIPVNYVLANLSSAEFWVRLQKDNALPAPNVKKKS